MAYGRLWSRCEFRDASIIVVDADYMRLRAPKYLILGEYSSLLCHPVLLLAASH